MAVHREDSLVPRRQSEEPRAVARKRDPPRGGGTATERRGYKGWGNGNGPRMRFAATKDGQGRGTDRVCETRLQKKRLMVSGQLDILSDYDIMWGGNEY
jgi:hypothetical protein